MHTQQQLCCYHPATALLLTTFVANYLGCVAVTVLWNALGVTGIAIDHPMKAEDINGRDWPAKNNPVEVHPFSPVLPAVNGDAHDSWVRPFGQESWVGIPAYVPHSVVPLTPRVTFAVYTSEAFEKSLASK